MEENTDGGSSVNPVNDDAEYEDFVVDDADDEDVDYNHEETSEDPDADADTEIPEVVVPEDENDLG